MLTKEDIKKIAHELGADICGVGSVDRFDKAPDGFHPKDIFPEVKSVIVFGKKLPESVFFSKSPIPYSCCDEFALHEIMKIAYEFSNRLEKENILAVPIPSEPYEYWDGENMTGKGLLSLKHAACLAGLGTLGRNNMFYNYEYGNLIKLGALLTNIALASDPIREFDFCTDECELCIKGCPVGALNGMMVSQKKCRQRSESTTKKGAPITVCYNCRMICPYRAGIKNRKSTPF